MKNKNSLSISRESASFRDPSGFIFYHKNILYRQVNNFYKDHYLTLMNSGLYDKLVTMKLLIPHQETDFSKEKEKNVFKTLIPEKIKFISYPYEWSFSQLKDAALVTLKIMKLSLEHEMILKDCSAYNIQFKDSQPVLIDTLSFEKFQGGKQWIATYRQFCRHFLAPLLLMAYKHTNLNQLLKIYIDGIPIDLCSELLPSYTYFIPTILYHIHANAKLQKKMINAEINFEHKSNKKTILEIITKIEHFIEKITLQNSKISWDGYYDQKPYSNEAFDNKKEIIKSFLKQTTSEVVLDLGANTGIFSIISSDLGFFTVSIDNDHASVEQNYLETRTNKRKNLLPLLVDILNPSPNLGWENNERLSFLNRISSCTIMALALIHHLVISNNLPFNKIAELFAKKGKILIIEFVPKTDSKVKLLLSRMDDIFQEYTQENFEKEFEKYFEIIKNEKIKDSERILYLMKIKSK